MVNYIYAKTLNSPSNKIFNRLFLKLMYHIRVLVIKQFDPLVEIKIGNINLTIPLSHDLPIYFKIYPYYSSNLGRLAKYVQEKYTNLTFIDIGANIGDSVALLRKDTLFPILCIEGNKDFSQLLFKNTDSLPSVWIEEVYVGSKTEHINAEAYKKYGTAYLTNATNTIHVKTLPDILYNQPIFLKSKMIKIDTDGFDCLILRGASNFLQEAKPIIFFEYDPLLLACQNDDGFSIFSYLKSINYQNLLIYNNYGEYMISLEVSNLKLLEEIHNYFLYTNKSSYCDICIFHSEDNDLFKKIRLLEIDFFKNTAHKIKNYNYKTQ